MIKLTTYINNSKYIVNSTGLYSKLENIESVIYPYFKTSRVQLKKKRRKQGDYIPRYWVWYFLNQESSLRLTLERMGKLYNRDHSSVIAGLKTLQNLLDTDKNARELLKYFEQEINN